jgi:hypothetical protein
MVFIQQAGNCATCRLARRCYSTALKSGRTARRTKYFFTKYVDKYIGGRYSMCIGSRYNGNLNIASATDSRNKEPRIFISMRDGRTAHTGGTQRSCPAATHSSARVARFAVRFASRSRASGQKGKDSANKADWLKDRHDLLLLVAGVIRGIE